MSTVTLEMPESVFAALHLGKVEFTKKLRQSAATLWYQQGLISQERAAEVAGLDRTDFLQRLASEEIEVFHVDFEKLEQELNY